MMLRSFAGFFVVAIVFATGHAQAAGSGAVGGSSMPSSSTARPRTPEQLASSAYKSGQKYRKRAEKYEKKAARADKEKSIAKYTEKARAQYEKSIEKYLQAYAYDNSFHEALNELGYSYRKIGDYDNAIRSYNTALNIEPDYAQAIEYRGEAYLALGLFEKTKEAYMVLFRTDQDQAALLMAAMQVWVASAEENSTAEAGAFAGWIEERRALAEGTQTLSMNNARDW
jgi:tetratricopeptide (TPR) repeat protein